MESVQDIFAYFESLPLWLGLLAMTLAAGIEYVFPPFPGDSVTIVGAVLIPVAGWPLWAVFAALIVGSTFGAAADLAAGYWLASEGGRESWLHRLMQRPKVASKIDKIKQRFQRHGSWYIALNRFLPAFRALFFVAAGLARLEPRRVLVLAALSAAAWNAALLAVGYLVGYNLDALAVIVEQYTIAVLSGLGVLAIGWLAFRFFITRRSAEAE